MRVICGVPTPCHSACERTAGAFAQYPIAVRPGSDARLPAARNFRAYASRSTSLPQSDLSHLLDYLTSLYETPGRSTSTLVLIAEALVRLAAGRFAAGEPLPQLRSKTPGDIVSVAKSVLQIVRERAAKEGEELWPAALRTVANAETLMAASGNAPSSLNASAAAESTGGVDAGDRGADPAAPAQLAAITALRLCPWDNDAWSTWATARA